MDASDLPKLIIRYGTDPSQWVACADPLGDGPAKGLILLIHGGYWRSQYDASLMEPLADNFCTQGWAVANIEYRRGVRGVWPAPFADVSLALTSVYQSDWAQSIGGLRLIFGHSVGGQLALLASKNAHAVVALAPVTDILRTKDEGLGNGAVAEYFRTQDTATINSASPVEQLPLPTPTLIVHGASDRHVPLSHSVDFLTKAACGGAVVELAKYAEMDHFQVIDPNAEHWSATFDWIVGLKFP